MRGHTHVIPVDASLTATWATVLCDGEECANIEAHAS